MPVNRISKNMSNTESLTSRQMQALRTKENIYQSALRVIAKVGYKDASIEDITKEAGVSIGSFYTYFPSKEHLLLYTFVNSGDIYQNAYNTIAHLPFPENLYSYFRLSYFALEQRGREIMYGVNLNLLSPEFKSRVLDPERGFFIHTKRLLQSGVEQGVITDHDIDSYVRKIFITLTGVEMVWCLEDFKENLANMAEDSVRSIMEGLLP